MNAASFDEFGRMTANLGVEAVPATPGAQTVILYPFVNPQTELIDASGLPVGDVNVTPISSGTDGTQIWKITHNGVDTHPIHFHLFDVQVLNRVTWDNIIIPPEASELGWKDTVRVSPLEDTIVALRPIMPKLPFEIPNSVRLLNPMMPAGDTSMFNSVDPNGNPAAAITNRLVNFGWEYVFHCHILTHEEMDMMRPVSVAVAPIKAGTLASSVTGSGNRKHVTISWKDNSITETAFVLQKSTKRDDLDRRRDSRLAPQPGERPRQSQPDRSSDLRPESDGRVPGRRREHGRLRSGVPVGDGEVDLGVARRRLGARSHITDGHDTSRPQGRRDLNGQRTQGAPIPARARPRAHLLERPHYDDRHEPPPR